MLAWTEKRKVIYALNGNINPLPMYTHTNLQTLSVEELRSMHDNEEAEKKWLISQIRKEHAPKQKKLIHPSYEIMVTKAISDLKQRNGSSRAAIKKYILANYNVNEKLFGRQFTVQMRRLVERGVVHQPREGPNASFKITPEKKAQMQEQARK